MSQIAEKVKKIIIDKLGVDESEVTNEASFTNDLGADSLDTVELIMEFEKEFHKKTGSPQKHKFLWIFFYTLKILQFNKITDFCDQLQYDI